ncbi:hypothetical protein E0Z10_g4038 [Xylaria hypoxylon]|uniref:SUN domain-containing protein n=1 Tax=Xylaria hypoxylon TaxID=37992 RepID=A0A4Z0YZ38_9PEZI|nr:hypothetical protein E0Z10_g4038 [Xylaria hypoxylon]
MPPKTKKKGSDSSPQQKGPDPNPDLPGLFPSHDGSYGINTLVNNTADSKKGQKPTAGVNSEQLDDKKWAKSIKSKVNKYGMNGNLKKAIDESHEGVEEEEYEEQNPPSSSKPSSSSLFSSSSASGPGKPSTTSHYSASSASGPGEPSNFLDDSDSIPQLTPHIPNYTSHNPFPEEYDDRPRPPYKPADLPSADPYTQFGVNQPISPPSEYIPFYGMPQGKGSKEPISPTRPNTSRSFNYESGLYSNATVQTPGYPTGLFGATTATSPWSGLPTQNQTTGLFGSTGMFNAGVQPTAQPSTPPPPSSSPASSMVPNSQGAPILTQSSGQPNTQGQPMSSWQSISGMQPKQQGQFTLGQFTSGLGQPTSSSQLPNVPNAPYVPNVPATVPTAPILVPNVPNTPSVPPPTPYVLNATEGQNKSSQNKSQKKKLSTGSNSSKSTEKGRLISLSSGLIIQPLVLFSVLFLALWITLYSTPIPEGFNYGDADIPPAKLTTTNFGFGTLWRSISDLLPQIPEIPQDPLEVGDINTNELISDLKEEMPESIWVQGNKTGNIKISEDFWHAVKERIERDDSILNLKNSDISEDHWRAIKSRIQTGGFEAGSSIISTEPLSEKKISQSWDKWLKQNDKALKKAVTGVALTKDDFMKLFKQEIAFYHREVHQELAALQDRIKDITERISRLPDEVGSSGSMTKNEISKLLDSQVSKAVKKAKLDAVAQGLIKGHANDVLANQVNFFGIGAGVSIDPESSSPAWKIPKDFFKSTKWYDKDGYKAQPRMAAVSPWSQEGECFCAGPDLKGYGRETNNISVIVSRNIIPQHLVVDHILSGATLDPGATPKEIEVWVYIEEVTLRNEVQTFSEAQFPDTPKEDVLNDGYVKIGHFTYEQKDSGDGIQVFKISDEIARMKAITNRIVVRAITNYGADHTCFYRLRLYGEIIERPSDPAARKEKTH